MLEISKLVKHYGSKHVLENMNLTAGPNEIIGLVGENGAGKTTLLKLLAGIERPGEGVIKLDGEIYGKQTRKIRRRIGYVPQEISIWEDFSVKENMLFFEKLSWKRRSEAECRKLCLDMELTQWEEGVDTLSGGMKRKLNLAISLLNDPDLLLLDEPTVGIDLKSKNEIGKFLRAYSEKPGKLLIYTSHDMDEIISLCDRVLVIGEDPFYYHILKERGVNVERLSTHQTV